MFKNLADLDAPEIEVELNENEYFIGFVDQAVNSACSKITVMLYSEARAHEDSDIESVLSQQKETSINSVDLP